MRPKEGAEKKLLGHKTLAVTQQYSHLVPERLQNAVRLLDGWSGKHGIWATRWPRRFESRVHLTLQETKIIAKYFR